MDYEAPTTNEPAQPDHDRITELELQLGEARDRAAGAIAQLADYKASVRRTVIANIKNGTICLSGANEALESWGDEPYSPRFRVRILAYLDVEVNAESSERAEDAAVESVHITTYDDEPLYVDSIEARSAEEIPEDDY